MAMLLLLLASIVLIIASLHFKDNKMLQMMQPFLVGFAACLFMLVFVIRL